MKIQNKTTIRASAALFSGLARGWMKTLDYRCAYYDPIIDPAYANDGKIRLYLFWHEYIPFFIHLRHHCGLAMLLSRHSDANILQEVAQLTGFDTVRGSTRRGGAEAIHGMMAKSRRFLHLTMTPDGPRGPRRTMTPGAVFLASKLGIPIIAMGVGYDRPWRLSTWDRFAIPRPGSRGRVISSGDILVPDDLSRAGIAHYTKRIDQLLNRLTEQAEDWAEKGYAVEGESGFSPGPKHSVLYQAEPRRAIREGE